MKKINTKIVCEEEIISFGGNAANTMVGLSRLGVECTLSTIIGEEKVGEMILESLKMEKINTTKILREGNKSSHSFILINKQKQTRTIINKKGASYHFILPIHFFEDLNHFDAFYFDSRFYLSAFECLQKIKQINQKNEKKIPVFLGIESQRHDFDILLPFADIVITNQNIHKELFGNQNFEENLKFFISKGAQIAITTLGIDGSICITKSGQIFHNKAHQIDKVVDTNGAGDAFVSAFIFGYLKKWNLEKILLFSNFYASQKCTRRGSRDGLLFLKEIPSNFLDN